MSVGVQGLFGLVWGVAYLHLLGPLHEEGGGESALGWNLRESFVERRASASQSWPMSTDVHC